MIVVIADDLTGAAEIAGIAWRNGLLVRMIMRLTRTIPTCDVLVIATNTRQATKAKAIKETDDLMHKLSMLDSPLFFYKKTDSALRGHIVAELNAMMLASMIFPFIKASFITIRNSLPTLLSWKKDCLELTHYHFWIPRKKELTLLMPLLRKISNYSCRNAVMTLL